MDLDNINVTDLNLMDEIRLVRGQRISQNKLTDKFNFQPAGPVTGRGMGNIAFFGLEMAQNQNAPLVFDAFFKSLELEGVTPARIIETGTGPGGLTVLLKLYCVLKGVELITYDIREDMPGRANFPIKAQPLFDLLQIDARTVDVFTVTEEIKQEIAKPGVSIILCDAEKTQEFNNYAPSLKVGDFMLCHDYAPDPFYFINDMMGKTWSFLQVREIEIIQASVKHHLEYYMKDEFQSAAWVCKRKMA